VLKEVFAGSGISYVIMGDDIILKLEKKAASTQQKKVEIVGGVVDARSGESVVGATVRVKDVNSGVITDMDGKFTIKATPGDVLVISYIGYETKEVKVVNGKVLLVELVEDAKQLEEVVVTAYGSGQKKASMVGSVQAIRPAELQVPSASLSNSFAGRLAGVIAVQRTGQPGADGPDLVVIIITPLAPRVPYIAVAVASFKIEKPSMISGSRLSKSPEDISTPSNIISGLVAPFIVEIPRI
jgi:tRNA-binding EMAP/Myf-like protein